MFVINIRDMKQLFLAFYRKLEETDMRIERYLKSQIDWNNRLTAITGARGTGKTTMLLRHYKNHTAKQYS
ncbi:MAG: hypothetical protein GX277_04335 [Bacteroidales bacterium]|jgi:predicted AAA+ superfamily ATPase|nr:hypothetical protein [Bacteroidales bacterium]